MRGHNVNRFINRLSTLVLFFLTVMMIPPDAFCVTLAGGTITTDTTWTLTGSPYIVTGSITVQGADGADGVTTLTIEPGVEVRFNAGFYLYKGVQAATPER